MDIEELMAMVDTYCDAAIAAGVGTTKIGFAEGLIAKSHKDALREKLQYIVAKLEAAQRLRDAAEYSTDPAVQKAITAFDKEQQCNRN